jgi:hypothetical protein
MALFLQIVAKMAIGINFPAGPTVAAFARTKILFLLKIYVLALAMRPVGDK